MPTILDYSCRNCHYSSDNPTINIMCFANSTATNIRLLNNDKQNVFTFGYPHQVNDISINFANQNDQWAHYNQTSYPACDGRGFQINAVMFI